MESASYIASNFAFSCTYVLYYYIIISVSHCLNRTLSLSIEDNNVNIGKRKVYLGLFFIMSFTLFVALNIRSDREIYDNFFNSNP